MTDIDHFKTFNDTWGHLTGDQVLRLVAMSLKQNVKGQDIAARYGGEEFAVILPNTVLRSALTVADHIRRAVMSKELMKRSTGQNLGRVTISLGVATARKGDTAQSLIARADACLYAAKRNGRNRVICETDPEFARPPRPRSPDRFRSGFPRFRCWRAFDACRAPARRAACHRPRAAQSGKFVRLVVEPLRHAPIRVQRARAVLGLVAERRLALRARTAGWCGRRP